MESELNRVRLGNEFRDFKNKILRLKHQATLSGYERRSNENKETSLRFRAKDAERHGDNLKPDA